MKYLFINLYQPDWKIAAKLISARSGNQKSRLQVYDRRTLEEQRPPHEIRRRQCLSFDPRPPPECLVFTST